MFQSRDGRTRRQRRVRSIAILSTLVAVAAGAQEWRGPGRVKGVITDPDGRAVVGAEVGISWTEASATSSSKGPQVQTTDNKGRWSFVGLIDGDWIVNVDADGFIPFEDTTTVYARGGETLRLTLKPIPQEQIEAERLRAINDVLARGNELSKAGDHAGARAAYEEAMASIDDDRKPDVLAGIANTHIQENDHAEAISVLEQALALDGDNVASLKMMVAVLASQGRDDEAGVYLARLPDESTLDTNTRLNLGIMRYNEGELEEASQIFEQALTDEPSNAAAFYYSGLVFLNQQKNELAIERLRRYLDLDPEGAHSAEARDFVSYLEEQASDR